MILLPQTRRARQRRNCGGFLSLFGGNKTSSTTSTAIAVDSYNRSIATSENNSHSGNLNIAIGPDAGNPFAAPGDTVKLTALALAAVGFLGWLLLRKK